MKVATVLHLSLLLLLLMLRFRISRVTMTMFTRGVLFVMLRVLGEQRQQCQATATGSAALNNNFLPYWKTGRSYLCVFINKQYGKSSIKPEEHWDGCGKGGTEGTLDSKSASNMDLCVCVCVRTHVVRYILYSTYYIELGFFTLLSHRFILMLLFSFFRCHYIILHNGKMRQKTGKSSQVKGKYEKKKRGNVCVCV